MFASTKIVLAASGAASVALVGCNKQKDCSHLNEFGCSNDGDECFWYRGTNSTSPSCYLKSAANCDHSDLINNQEICNKQVFCAYDIDNGQCAIAPQCFDHKDQTSCTEDEKCSWSNELCFEKMK